MNFDKNFPRTESENILHRTEKNEEMKHNIVNSFINQSLGWNEIDGLNYKQMIMDEPDWIDLYDASPENTVKEIIKQLKIMRTSH